MPASLGSPPFLRDTLTLTHLLHCTPLNPTPRHWLKLLLQTLDLLFGSNLRLFSAACVRVPLAGLSYLWADGLPFLLPWLGAASRLQQPALRWRTLFLLQPPGSFALFPVARAAMDLDIRGAQTSGPWRTTWTHTCLVTCVATCHRSGSEPMVASPAWSVA